MAWSLDSAVQSWQFQTKDSVSAKVRVPRAFKTDRLNNRYFMIFLQIQDRVFEMYSTCASCKTLAKAAQIPDLWASATSAILALLDPIWERGNWPRLGTLVIWDGLMWIDVNVNLRIDKYWWERMWIDVKVNWCESECELMWMWMSQFATLT